MWWQMDLLLQSWRLETETQSPRQPAKVIVKKKLVWPQCNVCLVEFWRCDSLGFVRNGHAVNADLYSQHLERVHEILRWRYPELVPWNIFFLQQDKARPHTARTTMTNIQKLGGIELLPQPAYSPDLAPSDSRLMWKKFLKHWINNMKLVSKSSTI